MSRLSPPQRIEIYLTHICNLSCPFCYYFNDNRGFSPAERGLDDLPVHVWLKFLEDAASHLVMKIGLLGGEPMLYPEIDKILDFFAGSIMRFNIISNGTTMTEENVAKLVATNRCDKVQVSIDGKREFHDKNRGAGVYDQAIAGIRRLRAAGMKTMVNMVLMRENLHDFMDTVKFLREELDVNLIRVNRITSTEPGIALTEEEIADAINQLAPYAIRNQGVVRGGIIKDLAIIKHPYPPEKTDSCVNCQALFRTTCCIKANGDVIPCTPAGQHPLGNICRDDFYALWEGEKWESLRQSIRVQKPYPMEDCVGCSYAPLCRRTCLLDNVNCEASVCYRKIKDNLNY